MFSRHHFRLIDDIIVLGTYQRVYPNTHCSEVGKLEGSQWVLSDTTLGMDGYTVGIQRVS
jgi:hypothetical protein